jgi:hypothetical protein
MLQTLDLLTIKVFEYGARPAAGMRAPPAASATKTGSDAEGVRDRGATARRTWSSGSSLPRFVERAPTMAVASGLDCIDAAARTANLREMSYAPDESAGHRLPIGAVGNSVQAT